MPDSGGIISKWPGNILRPWFQRCAFVRWKSLVLYLCAFKCLKPMAYDSLTCDKFYHSYHVFSEHKIYVVRLFEQHFRYFILKFGLKRISECSQLVITSIIFPVFKLPKIYKNLHHWDVASTWGTKTHIRYYKQ